MAVGLFFIRGRTPPWQWKGSPVKIGVAFCAYAPAGSPRTYAIQKRLSRNVAAIYGVQHFTVAKTPQEQMRTRALVVESDPDVVDMLLRQLRETSVGRVDHAADGQSGVAMAESFEYQLICTELLVPKLGGPQLCRALRAAVGQPWLMAVTAKADAVSGLLGMETGIDDYVLKPVEPRELVRKVQQLLERPRRRPSARRQKLSDSAAAVIRLSHETEEVFLEGTAVPRLSTAEFEMVALLATNAGVWLSDKQILATLWGLYPPVTLKALGVNLRVLGMKMKGPTGHRYLEFHKGRVRLRPGMVE